MRTNSIVVEKQGMRVEIAISDQEIEQIGDIIRAALIGLTFHPDTVEKILPMRSE